MAERGTTRRGRAGFRSVLVPLDLSAAGDRVLRRVSLLPVAEGARVTLVHVVPRSLPPRARRKAEQDAHRILAEEVRHARRSFSAGVELDTQVKVGAAAKEIAASARRAKAELIVMGRGPGRALRDAFLGSTAERVIRQARLPVLVVRLPARGGYRHPAMALDVDPPAREVVRLLLRVISEPWPRVDVIHALDAPYRGMYPSLSQGELERWETEERERVVNELREVIEAGGAAARVPPTGAPLWKMHVQYGSPLVIVERAVRKAENDLLVLGTRGYAGAPYMFLGSVAGDLARAVPCDVLLVPPGRS